MKFIKPLAGRITSKYGNRLHPVTKVPDRFHNGVDIAAVVGAKVVSPADGKILQTYDQEFGGLTMIILHDNGYESRMCHLNKFLKKAGDIVKQGDEVAHSGNTGRSSGPHLHYGMRDKNKNYVDPQTLITFG
jgi:murein DD-endopeptidase MepM/ murein hydrolase activator NlpD